MSNLSSIGLNQEKSQELANKLNKLLADYQIFYMNVRGFHWNIKGDRFFELHLKFEELYNDILLKVDEVAERILTLGFTPIHAFSDYIELSEIKEAKNLNDSNSTVKNILDSFKILLTEQRSILSFSDGLGDDGTSSTMSDYIRAQEKLVWMYSSFLK
ncbi:MAG: Dps family protein [Candidatus Sericytochromatia bacterium]